MIVNKEVGTYQVLMISGYSNPNQIGFVYFYEPGGACPLPSPYGPPLLSRDHYGVNPTFVSPGIK